MQRDIYPNLFLSSDALYLNYSFGMIEWWLDWSPEFQGWILPSIASMGSQQAHKVSVCSSRKMRVERKLTKVECWGMHITSIATFNLQEKAREH